MTVSDTLSSVYGRKQSNDFKINQSCALGQSAQPKQKQQMRKSLNAKEIYTATKSKRWNVTKTHLKTAVMKGHRISKITFYPYTIFPSLIANLVV